MRRMDEQPNSRKDMKIKVKASGPYLVAGGVPLVRKIQIVSENIEPLTWKTTGAIPTGENYILCRCGKSGRKPFCDGMHAKVHFDGTETAATEPTRTRRKEFPAGVQITVRHDDYLCMESGFCGTRWSTIEQLVCKTKDSGVRGQVIGMIERCPSGSLVYSMDESSEDVEPDLPRQIAVTTDITSDGQVEGALWVTGGIPVERADGRPFEIRNRVTLCSCGRSSKKPLCDGAHRRKQ
jgi:CDGSH-type Zn-finger protein